MSKIIAEISSAAETDIILRTTAAEALVSLAGAYDVTDSVMLQLAADQLKEIVGTKKQLDGMRTEMKKPFLDGGREVDALFKAPIAFCEQAEKILKGKCSSFQIAQERERQEAMAKARAEADAEARRIEAEQRAIADALRAQAESSPESSAALNEQAASIEAMPVIVPIMAPAECEPVKISGLSSRSTWKAEIVDLDLFVRAALESKELFAMIQVDMSALNARARAARSALIIPGVVVVEEKSVSVR